MMDPMMQQAMQGMVDPAAAAGGAMPSDQELLMLILQLIASGELSGPGVNQIAEFVGAAPVQAGADPMAGGAPSGGAPAATPMPPM